MESQTKILKNPGEQDVLYRKDVTVPAGERVSIVSNGPINDHPALIDVTDHDASHNEAPTPAPQNDTSGGQNE